MYSIIDLLIYSISFCYSSILLDYAKSTTLVKFYLS